MVTVTWISAQNVFLTRCRASCLVAPGESFSLSVPFMNFPPHHFLLVHKGSSGNDSWATGPVSLPPKKALDDSPSCNSKGILG
jgi:hypothetical protein